MRIPLSVIKTMINRVKCGIEQINIELTDLKGIILISGDDRRVDEVNSAALEYLKKRPENGILEFDNGSIKGVCLPVVVNRATVCLLCIEGKAGDMANIGRVIKANIETFLECEIVTDEVIYENRIKQRLLQDILSEYADKNPEELYKRAAAMDYDLALPRLVMVIELEPRENKYFNVRLNLGYNDAAERAMDEVVDHVVSSVYINNQDIVANYNSNEIVMLKSFVDSGKIEDVYSCMDIICRDIYDSVKDNNAFKIRISFGSLVSDFKKLRESYREARNIIDLGKAFINDSGVYKIKDMLFEYVTNSLPVQLVDMAVKPVVIKLKDNFYGSGEEVLYTVEQFLESNMNIARTAEKIFTHRNTVAFRLEKIKKVTGLDPVESFRDLLLLKLAIVYMRLKS